MKKNHVKISVEEFVYEMEVMLKDFFVGQTIKNGNDLYVVLNDNAKFCLHIEKIA